MAEFKKESQRKSCKALVDLIVAYKSRFQLNVIKPKPK